MEDSPRIQELRRRIQQDPASLSFAPLAEELRRAGRIQDAIDTPTAQRTPLQQQLYLKVLPQITLSDDEVGKAMKGQDRERWDVLRAEMARAVPVRPSPVPLAIGITDVVMAGRIRYLMWSQSHAQAPEPPEPAPTAGSQLSCTEKMMTITMPSQ